MLSAPGRYVDGCYGVRVRHMYMCAAEKEQENDTGQTEDHGTRTWGEEGENITTKDGTSPRFGALKPGKGKDQRPS